MPFKTHREFYEDPTLYDEILWESSDGEEEFYCNLAKKHKKVLYLGSGTGRIIKPLLNVTDNLTCVEISKKFAELSQKDFPKARILHLDFLKLNLAEEFDLIIAPYEFVNHFEDSEVKTLTGVVEKHLSPDGEFVADLKNPYELENLAVRSVLVYAEVLGNYFEKGYLTVYKEDKKYVDYIERLNLKTNEHQLIQMEWYYYYKEDMEKYLSSSNLKITDMYGSYIQEEYTKDSERMIFSARLTKP